MIMAESGGEKWFVFVAVVVALCRDQFKLKLEEVKANRKYKNKYQVLQEEITLSSIENGRVLEKDLHKIFDRNFMR